MKKTAKLMTLAAVMVVGTAAFAGPAKPPRHHDGGNDGLRLAAGIVNLVADVLRPAPVVVTTPPPPPAPVVVTRPAPPPPAPVVVTKPAPHRQVKPAPHRQVKPAPRQAKPHRR